MSLRLIKDLQIRTLPRRKPPRRRQFHGRRLAETAQTQKNAAWPEPLTAAECYRFALSKPSVDVCMTGAKSMAQMRENLGILEKGPLTGNEFERVE